MPQFVLQTISHGPAETEMLGRQLAGQFTGGELLAFTGGMGVGKTTFCRGLAAGLGSTDNVTSPSFAIVNLYRGRIPLAHFDAWRIGTPEDLETAGFYDYRDSGAVVAVEWSENIQTYLEPPFWRVAISTITQTEREVRISREGGL